jgi:hypothetical protein
VFLIGFQKSFAGWTRLRLTMPVPAEKTKMRDRMAQCGSLQLLLHKGDVLMVARIDRLARGIGDLQGIVRAVGHARGIRRVRD